MTLAHSHNNSYDSTSHIHHPYCVITISLTAMHFFLYIIPLFKDGQFISSLIYLNSIYEYFDLCDIYLFDLFSF